MSRTARTLLVAAVVLAFVAFVVVSALDSASGPQRHVMPDGRTMDDGSMAPRPSD